MADSASSSVKPAAAAVSVGARAFAAVPPTLPCPHLFVSASITVLWAAAAALVPAMQKGILIPARTSSSRRHDRALGGHRGD
ncbi:hypothetical protein RO787_29070, partial [Blautia coccoides]|uniref:hypothetical protein n=1 Tax=Blautia producta TaxID=33035 RepID=UPI0028A4D374